jgi:hypothetical protein
MEAGNTKTIDFDNSNTLLDLSFVQISASVLRHNRTNEIGYNDQKKNNITEFNGVVLEDKMLYHKDGILNFKNSVSDTEKRSHNHLRNENNFWQRYQELQEFETFLTNNSVPQKLRFELADR